MGAGYLIIFTSKMLLENTESGCLLLLYSCQQKGFSYGFSSSFPFNFNGNLLFILFRRLLGIITKKDILRHMAQTANQDPASIMFN